ncbi:hypothetical protein [Labrys wisconsinensis]|uniref:N-acetyltransferase domain-containing protein n=1 Tax=Labrys wisconsinensis TaxID=425677 RepID=A0ABU0JMZ5_9HYPH|nr:hypothetical protein [Labrys wisconsinensis]MDQ0475020.1 hypothetical protein [Labrys wisconsinensis]
MIPVELRLSRQTDIYRFGPVKATAPLRFYGLTAWAGRRCVGMGGVAKTLDDGRHWGFVLRAPDYHDALGRGLHRKALRFLAGLKRNRVAALYATVSEDVPRAAEWMARLGFQPTDEIAPDGKQVHVKRLF